jgi:hypothetical protein
LQDSCFSLRNHNCAEHSRYWFRLWILTPGFHFTFFADPELRWLSLQASLFLPSKRTVPGPVTFCGRT